MSSAILYLAIVAIWAAVLMPRWLRSRHAAPRTPETDGSGSAHATGKTLDPVEAESAQDADSEEGQGGHSSASGSGGTSQRRQRGDSTRQARTAPGPGREREIVWPSPTQQRARILKARRRALITLLVLTAGAVAMALTHLAASWVIVPPAVMLAGFLFLLREATRIDAERARAARARATRASASPEERLPGERHRGEDTVDAARPGVPGPVPAAESTAEVIDFSARMDDQPYDQYSDAAERAVGD